MIMRTPPVIAVDDLPSLIAAEFDEQPGLRLTFPQVRRMWGLTDEECRHVLQYLITTGHLVRDGDRYRRQD
jgi:hypothetical protein